MSSLQHMRDFICQRLTAAAEEIFTEFEKTVVHYEEEIDRQRRLLEITLSPRVQLHRIVIPQQLAVEEDAFADQKCCSKEKDSSLNQKQRETPEFEKENISEVEPDEQSVKYVCREPLRVDTEEKNLHESLKPFKCETCGKSFLCDRSLLIHTRSHEVILEQQVCKKKEVFAYQTLCNEERDYSQNQEEPETPQIKEEHEELCTNQGGAQIKEEHEELCTNQGGAQIKEEHEELCTNQGGAQIKEEHEELCTNQGGAQIKEELNELGANQEGAQIKVETDTSAFTLSPTHQVWGFGEEDTDPDQPNSQTSSLTERQHQEGMGHSNDDNSVLSENKSNVESDEQSVKSVGKQSFFEKPFVCTICGKGFSEKRYLNDHNRIHSVEKSFTCTVCGKGFPIKQYLNLHKRTHSGEKPFVCTTCGKGFSQKGSLNLHKRTHSGEKPFVCTICGKVFSRKGNLIHHKRTHSGEKPFVCTICGKGFAVKCHLNNHERTHSGEKPFLCTICGKGFTRKGHLSVHERTHSGEKP
ncbi:uncharacterized protein ACNS7B_020009 isoform 8-T8 [Menidia menidia]